MLERAMDRAEASLSERDVTPDTTESDLEDPATHEALSKSQPEKPTPSRERDGTGKFSKGQKLQKSAPDEQILNDQTANADDVEADTLEETQDDTPIDAPAFWPADKKEAFAKAPREVQKAFLEVDAQRNEWANRLANESERGKAIEKRSKEVFEPHRLKLQANGISDPLQAAERLLAWNEIFESNPKVGIADLMRKNGLTPHDFFEDVAENQYPSDPRIDEAIQNAQEAKQLAEEWKGKLEEQQAQAFQSQVEAFKSGVDTTGQQRKAYAEMYAPQISQAAEAIQKIQPNMPIAEVLHHAYEFAVGEARKAFGVTGKAGQPTQPKEPQQIIAQARKASAASGSVTGAPSNGAAPLRPRAKSIDEAMDRAEERMGLR